MPLLKDFLLNPFDKRGAQWHPWCECQEPYDYKTLAQSFIPSSHSEDENFWFTIENLKKFSQYAPFLIFGILALITVSWFRDGFAVEREKSVRFGFCSVADSLFSPTYFHSISVVVRSLFARKNSEKKPRHLFSHEFYRPLQTTGRPLFSTFYGISHERLDRCTTL